MQHFDHLGRVNRELIDQQRVHLGVAVLLHHKDGAVRIQKVFDRGRERERPQPHGVDGNTLSAQLVQRLLHGRAGGAKVQHADQGGQCRGTQHGLWHQVCRSGKFAQQPLHVVDVVWPSLTVAGIGVAGGAAGKKTAFAGVGAGQRAPRNAVAIDVFVTAKVFAGLQFFCSHHLAAVIVAVFVPNKGLTQALVHANVEVGHEEDGGLQAVGQVQRGGGKLKALVRVFGQQHHMLGVAVRGIGAGQQIRLLGAGGHAGGWAAALHIDDGDRDFSKVGQADELGHQRYAGARCGGKSAGAVPASANHHTDRGQFVFGLHDGKPVLAGGGVDPKLVAVLLERLWHRG